MAAYASLPRRPGQDICSVCFVSKSIGTRVFWAAQDSLNSTHDPEATATTRGSQLRRWEKAAASGCLTCELALHCRSTLGHDVHFS